METASSTYGIYVLYGFEPAANHNRCAFISWDFRKEIGVGSTIKGNLQAMVGLDYYTDDLTSFLLLSYQRI
jgi:hypothetical protein